MVNQIRTIRLYGKLGAKFGRVHRMAVTTVCEAVQALKSQYRGFEKHMMESKDNGVGYAVFIGKNNIAEEQLLSPADDDIRIAPILLGSKNGGFFQIILGAALIFVGGLTLFAGPIGTALISLGWSMVIGGIIQLLTPVPKGKAAKDTPANTASFSFNGPINTQAQGAPVGVLYGELIIGSAVISAAIKPVDVFISNQGVGGGGFRWHNQWIAIP